MSSVVTWVCVGEASSLSLCKEERGEGAGERALEDGDTSSEAEAGEPNIDVARGVDIALGDSGAGRFSAVTMI